MEVLRDEGLIIKYLITRDLKPPYTEKGNRAALKNEAEFLKVMEGSGFTPDLLDAKNDYIVQTDVGKTEPMQDGEAFRRNCVLFLHEIRRRNVRHGDLTGPNVIIRDDWPWVIDWQEAHFIGQKAPQKSPFSDSYLMWKTVAGTISAKTQSFDVPRVARRWLVVLGALGATNSLSLPLQGKSLLDLGCFQGDFVAAASAEGMVATGVDMGGFRSGGDSIAEARELWKGLDRCFFSKQNLMDINTFNYDVVLLFSTFPYIVQQVGNEKAFDLLFRIVQEAGVLFFETQLYGDGPGPDFLKTEEDVGDLLNWVGTAKKLVTIPVWSRPASRTVWEVRQT